ncbi:MAG: endonuclease Q family protein [bacterium]|nr:endonuclease Q family protein [bacterium]
MFFADFHLHSKYSRATSPDMDLEHLNFWAQVKGIQLITTGDFTHPKWFDELSEKLEPAESGLFTLKKKYQKKELAKTPYILPSGKSTRFILTTELSAIYSQNGKVYRIHHLIFAPSLDAAEKINRDLGSEFNLKSDGRPILGLNSKDLVRRILNISSECVIVPAHIWTPWFSLFGSRSGFDSLEECYGEYAKDIYAAETGLSSDPAMNWQVGALDRIALISNSDAHSPRKIGREANAFNAKMSYNEIKRILKTKDKNKFLFTIEFFPEEGKYHYDGHSACNISLAPKDSKAKNNLCPVCHRTLTIGVLHRVDDLADRPLGFKPANSIPFKNLIPLEEIIADVLDFGVNTQTVQKKYFELIRAHSNELEILFNTPVEILSRTTTPEIAQAVINSRAGKVEIKPGYDGVYGKIKVQRPRVKVKKQKKLF